MDDARGQNVLIVDDDPRNLRLLSDILRRGGLVPRPVTCGRLALDAASLDPPDLVLLDIRMPEMSGLEVCRQLKRIDALVHVPIIFLSGLQSTEDKLEAFRVGGVDFVAKPFEAEEVLARVTTHLQLENLRFELRSLGAELDRRVAEQVRSACSSQLATIFALAKLAEARDDAGPHIERVQTYSRALAERIHGISPRGEELTPDFLERLYQTSSLHDIGKLGIPDSILLKPGKLTPEEFGTMKKHCVLGSSTLNVVLERYPDDRFLKMSSEVARSHHERWDGRGYPDGLRGEAIPLAARIVSLADAYDALTSNRCYRPAVDHAEACRILEAGRGTQFDPAVMTAFISLEEGFLGIRQELGG
jgi:putative two-component system response regulator